MKKKLLILGVSAVQMDAILLLKDMGHEVHACAMAADGPGVKVADYFVNINILDEEGIIQYIKENSIDIIYSVGSDIAMPIAMSISEKLSLPHFVSSETATICNTKTKMRDALGDDCYGNLPYEVKTSLEEDPLLPMPFILKPSDSQGQRGVYLIKELKEYREKFEEVKKFSRRKEVILEKYVEGPELSVNAYLINGQVTFILISDRITWSDYTGLIHKHVLPSKHITNEIVSNIHKLVMESCTRLNILNGPVYLQIKLDSSHPSIIEITPRLDGCHMWKLIKYHMGINLLKLTFEHLIYQDTSELDNILKNSVPVELEFFCQEPGSKFLTKNFVLDGSKEFFFYYSDDSLIRSINGKFEKVGYKIIERR